MKSTLPCLECTGQLAHADDCSYAPVQLRERDHILNTAKSLISGLRHEMYGDARTDFIRTGRMWAAVLKVDQVTPEQVALCMALVKVGRLCESPGHSDSWVDACGYLALGGEIALTAGEVDK